MPGRLAGTGGRPCASVQNVSPSANRNAKFPKNDSSDGGHDHASPQPSVADNLLLLPVRELRVLFDGAAMLLAAA